MAYYLNIKDMIPDEKRDIEKVIHDVLSNVNKKSRTAA